MKKSKSKFKIKKDEKRQIIIEKSGDYIVELVGRGAEVEVLGARLLKEKEKLKLDIEIIHRAENTKSDVFVRVVCKDLSKAYLRGIIKVEKNAKNTEALLRENVLLVSRKACAEVIPDLEIESDEVKCSHAATVGKINKEQVFYLMSRGLSVEEAEKEIVNGFLNEVRERIEK